MKSESVFVRHEPCPRCGSRDNLARYSDGSGWCFGCNTYDKGDGVDMEEIDREPDPELGLLSGEIPAGGLKKRGITEETMRRYSYLTGRDFSGKSVQIAQYRDEAGQIVAQKLRYADKSGFPWRGNAKAAVLFGQHLQARGKHLCVTEGEIDAMSLSQAMGNSWPVISVKNGASGAKRDLVKHLDFLRGFERVTLVLDNDEAGREAAEEAARAIAPVVNVHVCHLPLKDANDMLVAGREEELVRAVWDAPKYRPKGVLGMPELLARLSEAPCDGHPWPYPTLTRLTYGRRPGEIVALGAGVGVGKTEFLSMAIMSDVCGLRLPTAVLSSEQTPSEVIRATAGKLAGKRFHIPDGSWTQEELEEAAKEMAKGAPLFVYDRAEAFHWEALKDTIRYLAAAEGIKSLYLDNLTAVVASEDDERRSLDRLMKEIAGLAMEYGLLVQLVSHLSTPDGTPHEEGGRVLEKQFTGSRAIARWAHFMIGLERNKQAEDPAERNTMTVRVLKDRYTGRATGETFRLMYEDKTGRLVEPEMMQLDLEDF